MTDIKVTVPGTAHGRRVATALLALVALFVGRLAQAHRERRDIEHLMKLDDCYLKDIGIARCEIEAVVRLGRGGLLAADGRGCRAEKPVSGNPVAYR